jgi:hypothetical protein
MLANLDGKPDLSWESHGLKPFQTERQKAIIAGMPRENGERHAGLAGT